MEKGCVHISARTVNALLSLVRKILTFRPGMKNLYINSFKLSSDVKNKMEEVKKESNELSLKTWALHLSVKPNTFNECLICNTVSKEPTSFAIQFK